MSFKEVVLLNLAYKQDKQEVYSSYLRGGKVDEFIKALYHLNQEGLIYVPRQAWAWGGDSRPLPEDVVMTGVKLTSVGVSRAKQLITKYKKSR